MVPYSGYSLGAGLHILLGCCWKCQWLLVKISWMAVGWLEYNYISGLVRI